MHPLWGFGFFVIVNRFVHAEQSWGEISRPRLVAGFAAIGVFSYSLYLTHELVIMQAWWFAFQGLPAMVNTFLVVTPATIIFAWLYYLFCEKPYMRKLPTADTRSRRQAETLVAEGRSRSPLDEVAADARTRLTLESAVESEICCNSRRPFPMRQTDYREKRSGWAIIPPNIRPISS